MARDPRCDVRLVERGFDPQALIGEFCERFERGGGVCSYIGFVRPNGDVRALELSHYEPLTLPAMRALADELRERFALLGLLIVHRVGQIAPKEPIVCVAASAHHRREAIEAVDCAMDHLKSRAWLWKRELTGEGWRWIEPRAQDFSDLRRWDR